MIQSNVQFGQLNSLFRSKLYVVYTYELVDDMEFWYEITYTVNLKYNRFTRTSRHADYVHSLVLSLSLVSRVRSNRLHLGGGGGFVAGASRRFFAWLENFACRCRIVCRKKTSRRKEHSRRKVVNRSYSLFLSPFRGETKRFERSTSWRVSQK